MDASVITNIGVIVVAGVVLLLGSMVPVAIVLKALKLRPTWKSTAFFTIVLGLFLYNQFDFDQIKYESRSDEFDPMGLVMDEDSYKTIIDLKKEKRVRIKSGVNVHSLRYEISNTVPLVIAVYKQVLGDNYIPVITSGNDGKHSKNSLHYKNLAMDWRVNNAHSQKTKRIYSHLINSLGDSYKVLLEDIGTPNAHIHIGYKSMNDRNETAMYIIETAKENNVDPALAMAIIHQESRFNQEALSKVGALGMTQLMPGTANDVGVNRHNRKENIKGGILYIRQMLTRYKGNEKLALAAYNSGMKHIDSAIKKAGSRNWNIVKQNLVTKYVHQIETIDYVKRITKFKKIYELTYRQYL